MDDIATGDTVSEIVLRRSERSAAVGIAEGDAPEITHDFHDGGLLYVSQMGTTAEPNFDPSIVEGENNLSNLYIYEWYYNPAATWEDDYNFRPGTRPPLKWAEVLARGSVGNAFSLYAMYFPVDHKIRFDVETDQSTEDNVRKSDIMGAYHATSALYSRLRFRLYHLMVYLKVKLYVPVYQDDEDGNGYSGFEADAFQSALLRNAITDFGVEWRANRSSDTDAPLVMQRDVPTRSDIVMYSYPDLEPAVTDITVSDYYGTDDIQDRVRVYNFSVIFPGQKFGDNFLRFCLKNTEGTDKYYYFSASQLKTGATDFNFTQGTLQELNLYLPRTGNTTILVKANILPWIEASTDMTVIEQPKEADD